MATSWPNEATCNTPCLSFCYLRSTGNLQTASSTCSHTIACKRASAHRALLFAKVLAGEVIAAGPENVRGPHQGMREASGLEGYEGYRCERHGESRKDFRVSVGQQTTPMLV
jgi:hypothetical protein